MNRTTAVLAPGRSLTLLFCTAASLLLLPHRSHAQLDSWSSPEIGLEFLRVPAGIFVAGSDGTVPGTRIDERQHQVILSHDYWLSATEVSQRQWVEVMGENPSYLYDCPDCPVEQVSWYDAIRFCNALSLLEGRDRAYSLVGGRISWNRDAGGYRLPTEAEWEHACRAGTTGAFWTGRCLGGDAGNYDGYSPQQGCAVDLSRGQTIAVDSLDPNPWGFHHMHGNVFEWCWDGYAFFDGEPLQDPIGDDSATKRVTRGGCFLEPEDRCRSSSRASMSPTRTSSCLGFRVARSAR